MTRHLILARLKNIKQYLVKGFGISAKNGINAEGNGFGDGFGYGFDNISPRGTGSGTGSGLILFNVDWSYAKCYTIGFDHNLGCGELERVNKLLPKHVDLVLENSDE
jgi:hypothetical protein